MKKRGLRLLITAVSIAILAAATSIMLPKMILYYALKETKEALTDRFTGDPLWIPLKIMNSEGKYTLSGSAELSGSSSSTVRLDGVLETDLTNHRFLAQGNVITSDKALDLSLYMEPEYLAVSSQQLTEGNHYGITYDTFPEDIRSIPLLSIFITDSVFSRWENSIQAIQEWTLREYPGFSLLDLPEKMFKNLSLGLLALPCTADTQTLTINGKPTVCKALTYNLNENQTKEVFPQARQGTNVSLSFCLNGCQLAAVQWQSCYNRENECWTLYLGQDPRHKTLTLQYTDQSGNLTTIAVDTQKSEDLYQEYWEITQKGETYRISYDWEKEVGKLTLSLSDDPEDCEIFLKETEHGVLIRCGQPEKLFPEKKKGRWHPLSCDLTVTGGSVIAAPVYKNLNQWSLEDFLLLAEGIGLWIGLRFN